MLEKIYDVGGQQSSLLVFLAVPRRWHAMAKTRWSIWRSFGSIAAAAVL